MSEKQDIEKSQAVELQEPTHLNLLTERERELLELEARLNSELDAKLLANPDRHPTAVYFILPNEFGERFCYYGVAPNLNKYFMQITGMSKLDAKIYTTIFNMLAYFFPLLGAALSDSFLGKWWTIISFSVIYLIGMILLTVFAIPNLLGPIGNVNHGLTFLPMVIIALGTGGIKPCVSSHGGDQYLPAQERAKDRFFALFYVSINVGALITQFVVPVIADKGCMGQKDTCYPFAFLLPTIVFFLSLVIFAVGHRWYRVVPPAGEFLPWKAIKAAFLARSRHSKASKEEREAKGHWLNFAEEEYGGVFLDECRDFALSMAVVVVPFSFCKMLYVQNQSEWATQYYHMNGALFGKDSKILAAQYSNLNTIFIITLLPFLTYVVYPFCERRGFNFTLKRRMAVGYFLVIVAFALSAVISGPIEEGFKRAGRSSSDPKVLASYDGTYCAECLSGWAQFPQWFLISLGECMFSPTGVQFMYVESGRQFRAVGTSFWLVASSFGSIWITIFDPAMVNAGMSTTARNWTYSGIGMGGLVLYLVLAWFYVPRKERQSINQAAREAKEAEYRLTSY
ncbi:hypothetical protein DFQ27_007392 [Actinomortierella ambigua]|uniref:Uncharacterized protein n=1 Tax=Actinomortierella ambigua TaxID=1343610 RepID=A0A9P6UBM7_9FUNG|nr:hypothetical protein DFQ27_007392 [Actinomortierella ambigua]